MENKNGLFTMVGATVLFSSLATVIDYSIRKKRSKASHAAELVAGAAGLMLGAALLAEPTQQARRALAKTDLIDDESAAETEQQIKEEMNLSVDRGAQPSAPARTVEVDDETSIEDFIWQD